jgi:ribosome-associated protein
MNNSKYKHININGLIEELTFKTSRSSGKGGQHVNKVSTKVQLIFKIAASAILSSEDKNLIYNRLYNKINKNGEIQIASSNKRSQLDNKNNAIEKFLRIINNALEPVETRIDTQPTISSKIKRITVKKVQSKKKELRKRITDED